MSESYILISALIPIFILSVCLIFVKWGGDVDVQVPKEFQEVKHGGLFLRKFSTSFSVFKFINSEKISLLHDSKNDIFFLKTIPLLYGAPYDINVFFIRDEMPRRPAIKANVKKINNYAATFYKEELVKIKKEIVDDLYSVFMRSKFSLINREIWFEKNSLGYLIVVPGKLGDEAVFTNLQDYARRHK